jgi:hypothetical protein
MPDIFRETNRKREEAAGLRDVRAEKKTPEAVGMTQQQFGNAGKEDPRKKNLAQKEALLKKKGYKK